MAPSMSNSNLRSSRRQVLRASAAGAVLLGGPITGETAAAQGATPTVGTIPPIVQAWADAQNAMDPAAHSALYTADATLADVPNGSAVSGDAIQPFLEAVVGKLSDIQVELTSAFATDSNAAAEYQFSATNAGLIPVPAAMGKRYAVRTVTYFELADGKIRRSADYYDLQAVLKQLGLANGPGA